MIEGPSAEQVAAAVRELGSQYKAAEALGLTRPAVQRRLKALERSELKQRLRAVENTGPEVMTQLPKQTLVAFSCPHFPFQDKDAIAWLLGVVADEQPDVVVHLGDGVESSAAARWADSREIGTSLEEEYAGHNSFLAQLREAAPDAARYFLPGNHEDNITAPGRIDEKLRSLVDWRRPANQPELAAYWTVPTSYHYSRQHGRLVLGQVVLAHGYEHNAGSDEMHALHLANEYGLYIGGHTHKPKPVTQVRKGNMPLRYWYSNAGCLRDLSPHYVERSRKMDWGHACVVAEFVPLTAPVHGRYWEAETKVKCLFDEWAERHPPRAH